MKKLYILAFFAAVLSANASAVAVSSLFEVADQNGNGEISVLNNDGKDMFINITMSKVEYVGNKKVVTPLNKDTVADWGLSITPPQLILKPNQKKTVKLHYSCSKNKSCNAEKDFTYAIDMSPVPYSEGQKRAVAVAFGYRTFFLVPAEKIAIDYKLKRINKEEFMFENNSNTMLNVVINTCKVKFSNDCIYQYRTLPGAKKVTLYLNQYNRKIK